MRRQLISTFLAAGAIAVAMTLSSPAAMAAGTWTVTGGPSYTATQAAGTTFTQRDVTSGVSFTCTLATARGTVVDETMGTVTSVGTFTGFTFTHCTGPLGSTVTKTQKSGTTATITATTSAAGVTTGVITGIDEILAITTVLGACTAEIKGTAGFTYTNSSDLLKFTTAGDSLKVTSAVGACEGIIKVNDVITISSGTGGETVTGSPTNPIQISQP